MTNEQTALSRRVVTSPGWRWMPGMKVYEGFRVTESYEKFMFAVDRPDLTDAATLGCLLALVRKAWRCPAAYVRQSTTRRVSDGVLAWEVCDLYLDAEACRALGVPREGSVGSWGHGSEAEALVAALESAPPC